MQEITPYRLIPKNLEEAMNFSKMIAASDFAPKDYKGKPGNVLVACQMGADVGLSPMQAIQNIAVINGRPCIWGDAALAIVQNDSNYEYHDECFEFDNQGNAISGICKVKRKGQEEYMYRFSIDDAKKAGLWGKQGPWTQYPKRMLQLRARAFALRDKFSDALKGLSVREEVEDYQPINTGVDHNKNYTSKNINNSSENNEQSFIPQINIDDIVNEIKCATTLEELKGLYDTNIEIVKQLKDRNLMNKIISAKDERKFEIQSSFQQEQTTKEEMTEEDKKLIEEFNEELESE